MKISQKDIVDKIFSLRVMYRMILLIFFTCIIRPAGAQTGYLQPAVQADDTNLIILIHGWNPKNKLNMYTDTDDGGWLKNLKQELDVATAGTNWGVHVYRWEDDAYTGKIEFYEGYTNAAEAAVEGFLNGRSNLYSILNVRPNLRKVHFIAHSAGAWVAREAAEKILESNPYIMIQITLMDPFIPGGDDPEGKIPSTRINPGGVTPLTKVRMSELLSPEHKNRVYRLENYYCNDFSDDIVSRFGVVPSNTTSQEFSWSKWRTGWDIQRDTAYTSDLIDEDVVYGRDGIKGHEQPIHFMADSVKSTMGTTIPIRQTHFPAPGYKSNGFHRSMFTERFAFPRITSQPRYSTNTNMITATITNTSDVNYEWFKNGSSIPLSGKNASSLSIMPPSSGIDSYVLRAYKSSNPYLQTFSQKVTVAAVDVPQPRIDSVSPRYLTGKPLPQSTRITIIGKNFTSSSRLEFNDGIGAPYKNRVPATWSSTQLTYDVVVGMEAANWTVKVVDGAATSTPYAFYVIPPAGGKTLTGLVIEGPATVSSGGSAQFSAIAYYSDDTSRNVTVDDWDENSGSATISESGRLRADTVSGNRLVTVAASYTQGGVTKTTTTTVTIVAAEDSGGSQTLDVISNGDFESGEDSWILVYSAEVVEFDFPDTGDGYAYLGNANDVSGVLAQAFPVPNNFSKAILRYRINISSNETTVNSEFDKMTVLLAYNNQTIAILDRFSNLDERSRGSYVTKSYDLTNILGDYESDGVHLVFASDNDYSNSTIFRIDNVSLSMTVPVPVELMEIVIEGPSAVPENHYEEYVAYAIFSDGTTQQVTPSLWSENSSVSSIDGNGRFQTSSVQTDQSVSVSARYTFNGNTEYTSKRVTVFPVENAPPNPVTLDRLTIEGSGWVDEGTNTTMVGKAIFSDGSIQTVTPVWSLNSSSASINSNGRLSANHVNDDRIINIVANYSVGGISRTASKEVMIINGDDTVPILQRIEIVGPTTIEEGAFEGYETIAYYTDGTNHYVNPTWRENSSLAYISPYGLLLTLYVNTNHQFTVSASYLDDGILKNATKSVTILDVPNPQTSFFPIDPAEFRQSIMNDFDGDGKSDIFFYNESLGRWSILLSGTGEVVTRQWGGPGMVPVSGDYNGSGMADLAVYQPTTGAWFIRELAESRPPITFGQVWGGPDMDPVPGDYNGDGTYDLAVYQRDSGNWFIMSLGPIGPSNPPITFGQNWGSSRMMPVSGDYNGDGIADLAVYDIFTGNWFIRSLGAIGPANPPITFGQNWGSPRLTPVPGDYNGDGSYDLAVVDKETHHWFIRRLGPEGPQNPPISFSNEWGYGATQPRPGDYNGDGRYDLGIYDPESAQWFVKTLAEVALYFGLEFGLPTR